MNRIEQIYEQIETLKEELSAIQNACNHPEIVLKKEHKGNTGNYDPSVDCYWIEYHCGLCNKFWTEEK